MSDTPRTDKAPWTFMEVGWHPKNQRWVKIEFARELERENAALRNSQCTTWHLEELERENAALREALLPLLKHRPDGDIGWRDQKNAKCGWLLVKDMRIESALARKEAQP